MHFYLIAITKTFNDDFLQKKKLDFICIKHKIGNRPGFEGIR